MSKNAEKSIKKLNKVASDMLKDERKQWVKALRKKGYTVREISKIRNISEVSLYKSI